MGHGIELIVLAQLHVRQLRCIKGEPQTQALTIPVLPKLLDGILVGLGLGQLLFDR
jgi:hypothetical protein